MKKLLIASIIFTFFGCKQKDWYADKATFVDSITFSAAKQFIFLWKEGKPQVYWNPDADIRSVVGTPSYNAIWHESDTLATRTYLINVDSTMEIIHAKPNIDSITITQSYISYPGEDSMWAAFFHISEDSLVKRRLNNLNKSKNK